MPKRLYGCYIKRMLDIILSFIAIILLGPVIILLAILVKCKLGSPVIFKQNRPGLNEKLFTLYKFRTMTDEKDDYGVLLPDEARLTKFGRFLRSTSLDELPQLINILRGDLSIIGPRPLLVSYLPLYSDWQRKRHNVRPGLVGLAGVRGRNAQTWEDKFRNDVEYVNNLSFKLDCMIFFKALYIVLKRDGVNEEGAATASIFRGSNVQEKADKKIS